MFVYTGGTYASQTEFSHFFYMVVLSSTIYIFGYAQKHKFPRGNGKRYFRILNYCYLCEEPGHRTACALLRIGRRKGKGFNSRNVLECFLFSKLSGEILC